MVFYFGIKTIEINLFGFSSNIIFCFLLYSVWGHANIEETVWSHHNDTTKPAIIRFILIVSFPSSFVIISKANIIIYNSVKPNDLYFSIYSNSSDCNRYLPVAHPAPLQWSMDINSPPAQLMPDGCLSLFVSFYL